MKYWILFAGLLATAQGQACIHLSQGIPSQSDFIDCRLGYAIGYNYSMKSLDWVAYELKRQVGEGVGRTEDFREDLEIPVQYRTTLGDYDEPIYARGHMANSESLDGSEDMMSETFFMSNMVPQLPRHNGAIWKGLENRERKVANHRSRIFVFTGPLYEGEITYIGNKVPVPSHLWKVIFDPSNGGAAIAYIIDHKPLKTSQLKQFIVSIDEIEKRAELDLLTILNDTAEAALESRIESKVWIK